MALFMLFLNSQTHGNSNFLIYISVLTCLVKVLCKVNSGDNNQLLRKDYISVYDWQMVSTWIYINKSSKIKKKIANNPLEKWIKEQAMHGRGDLNGQQTQRINSTTLIPKNQQIKDKMRSILNSSLWQNLGVCEEQLL